jgi:predicted amidohydrolase YtcJ
MTRYDFFVVLEDDLLTLPEDRIKDLSLRVTIIGGRLEYEATPTPARDSDSF